MANFLTRRSAVIHDTAWTDPDLAAALPRVRKGDIDLGPRLLRETRGDYENRNLRAVHLSRNSVGLSAALAARAQAAPDDQDLALWQGANLIDEAWKIRSTLRAVHVSRSQFERFWQVLATAYEPLERAATLAPADPTPWAFLMQHGLGMQRRRSDLDALWMEVVQRAPHHYSAHYRRAQTLCKKWQGSDRELLEFGEATAASTPSGSPLSAILVAAHFELAASQQTTCYRYFQAAGIQAQLAKAADAWMNSIAQHPYNIEAHHLFGAAFWLGDDHDRARRHLGAVPRQSLTYVLPWNYVNSAETADVYINARASLGLK